jgi:hypothetical protein
MYRNVREGGLVAGDDTIEITDRSTFPDKIRKIESASAALRAFGHDLGAIVDEAREEASSFTATGKPAPSTTTCSAR